MCSLSMLGTDTHVNQAGPAGEATLAPHFMRAQAAGTCRWLCGLCLPPVAGRPELPLCPACSVAGWTSFPPLLGTGTKITAILQVLRERAEERGSTGQLGVPRAPGTVDLEGMPGGCCTELFYSVSLLMRTEKSKCPPVSKTNLELIGKYITEQK